MLTKLEEVCGVIISSNTVRKKLLEARLPARHLAKRHLLSKKKEFVGPTLICANPSCSRPGIVLLVIGKKLSSATNLNIIFPKVMG